MALPLFSATLFMSAFVLFLVQPMIGKMILRPLGGTPQVWNTCMMFFQMALLAGYSYAHVVSTRLSFRRHLAVHCALLIVPILLLFLLMATMGIGPFDFSGFTPTSGGNPILYTLAYLTLLVGCPFFVVSTTSPMLQRWFSHTGHPAAKDPYFLSIASNAGSLIGLLAYPALVEPTLGLHQQAIMWWVLFALLIGAIIACALTVWKSPELTHNEPAPDEPAKALPVETPPPVPQPQPAAAQATGITSRKKLGKGKPVGASPLPAAAAPARSVQIRSDEVTWFRRLRWVLLAAAPTSLMLGVVTYICTDLSPIPLLWVIPLALYLITFILVFLRYPIVWVDLPHKFMLFLQPVLVLGLCLMVIGQNFASGPLMHITLAITAFFATALVCHGELALDRPKAKYLTEFWLWVSVGGAVGGIFNALIAPIVFWGVVEFPIAIVLGCLVREQTRADGWTEGLIDRFFPGLVSWFRTKGDEIARNRKKPEPHNAYVLNYLLDFLLPTLLGVTTILLIYWTIQSWGWKNDPDTGEVNPVYEFWKKRGFTPNNSWEMTLMSYNVLVNFLPMVVCFLFYNRPIRLGLGVAAILLAQLGYQSYNDRGTIYAGRSYFGVLRVRASRAEDGNVTHSLMHGSTHHGLNYQSGPYRRMATTYYHELGPAGVVMLQYNWFRDGYRFAEENLKAQEAVKKLMAAEKLPGMRAGYERELAALEKALDNRDNWIDSLVKHTSDARLPASQVGLAVADLGVGLPFTQLVGAWSEPPYATIGLGTGTMAAYGRAFQHVHYYEIDSKIRRLNLPQLTDEEKAAVKDEAVRVAGLETRLNTVKEKLLLGQPAWEEKMKKDSLPERLAALGEMIETPVSERTAKQRKIISDFYLSTKENYLDARKEYEDGKKELFKLSQGPYFSYLMDAKDRKAEVQVRMGDARLRMHFKYPAFDPEAKEYAGYNEQNEIDGVGVGGGPDNFYHMMVVDAFSSDAIPIHLITKEAIEMYFQKLVPNGILCVHTSNRHVALVPVVEAVARTIKTYDPDTGETKDPETGKDLTLITRRAHDNSPYGLPGHFTSEWVMVARNRKILDKLVTPPAYEETAQRLDRARLTRQGYNAEQVEQIIGRRAEGKTYTYWLWPEERKAIGKEEIQLKDSEAWTDDYSNVLRVFRWESGHGWTTNQLLMLAVLIILVLAAGFVVVVKRNR